MTDQPGDEEDFMDEVGTSFSFDGTPPIRVRGTVQVDNPVKMQQRDFDTGDLLTWPDGNPKWQWRVDLQTDLRETPDDDGMRSLYLKYRSKKAVISAVKQSGAKRMERGGDLELVYTSNDHSQPHRTKPEYGCGPACQAGKGFPAKNYTATYEPPDQFASAAPAYTEEPPFSPAPAVSASGPDSPLGQFLKDRGVDLSKVQDERQARLLAQAYGYTGQ